MLCLLAFVLPALLMLPRPARACVTNLSSLAPGRTTRADDRGPQINASGWIVWSGGDGQDSEIYRWNPTTSMVEQLTTNTAEDRYPQASSTGVVTWMRYNAGSNNWDVWSRTYPTGEAQLSTNTGDDLFPRIATFGGTTRVIWARFDSTTGRYKLLVSNNGGAETTLSTQVVFDPESEDFDPQISDGGQIAFVWWDTSAPATSKIRRSTDGISSSLLPTLNASTFNAAPQVNASGSVVWHGWDSGNANWQVYLYNGTSTSLISATTEEDVYPRIAANGQIVWMCYGALGWEILRYAGSQPPTPLTTNAGPDVTPQIYGSGTTTYVSWLQTSDTGLSTVCLWNASTGTSQEISRSGAWNAQPQVDSAGRVIFLAWDGTYYSVEKWDPTLMVSLTVSQPTVARGTPVTGTVTLATAAGSGGATINLVSSNPDVAEVPASVVVLQGATQATFPINALGGTTAQAAMITATYSTCTLTDTLMVVPIRGLAVFRPSNATWYLLDESGVQRTVQFGATTDLPVPGAYDVAGRTQVAVFRPSTAEWFIRRADGSSYVIQHGATTDQPVPGDYLGTGRTQIAVYRPSTGQWFIRRDDGSQYSVTWGGSGKTAVPADYAGLGRLQIAYLDPAFNPCRWLPRFEDGRFGLYTFGTPTDQWMAGDYAGLGAAQMTVFRPGSSAQWLIRGENGGTTTIPWGITNDVPVAWDFCGLGRLEIGVFRPSTGQWLLRTDEGNTLTVNLGQSGDKPVPGNYLPN